MSRLDLSAVEWRKSSHSGDEGGECVEVSAAEWRKSSRSDDHGGECVEVADLASVVALRDSKDPGGAMLIVGAAGWRELVRAVKAREYEA
ncbi:DUF397 domain-containing protein [Actinomadura barringtoniae]|uniref:DUF397 domain-containing protein n=1 Tax=Actinomadura barringtoniae TaxID=1427535 RepID=A0A939PAT6_9ACTN|nr:DUF397 domain-containing protein [Actinomadura barringtoniae]MBO2449165.1 DUF397 domain-containing protein [Actinomadura barringtoniae]